MLMDMSHLVWKTKVSLCVDDEGKPPPVDNEGRQPGVGDEGMSEKGKQLHMDTEGKLPPMDDGEA